jgi:hypothetical protein
MKKIILLFSFLLTISFPAYANEKIIFSKDGLVTEKNTYNHESFILKPTNINPLFKECHLKDTTKIIIHKIDKGLIFYRGHIDTITKECNISKNSFNLKNKKDKIINLNNHDTITFKTF